MNFQSWQGVKDPRFGYGSMLKGFVDSIPKVVQFDEKASSLVYMGVPYGLERWFEGQYRSCFTMWETDQLPPKFVRWLGEYDQIIVPCEHNVELFSGHHPNVKYVPLGVDSKFWSPKSPTSGVFRFHAGGSLWQRKGLDIVVRVFDRLKLPNAELHIKAAPHAADTPSRVPKNVFLNRNWMTPEEQHHWFSQGHVYVSVSRGEGFGLMPLQAISMGIPTIVSHSTGQIQFEHLATGVVSTRKSKAEHGFWDETNEDELADIMVDHYRNWLTHKTVALANVKKVGEFSWRKATAQLLATVPVGTLLDTDTVETPDVAIPIQVNRNLQCDIGKNHFVFKKGETYLIDEGVYQVLYDAGVLV